MFCQRDVCIRRKAHRKQRIRAREFHDRSNRARQTERRPVVAYRPFDRIVDHCRIVRRPAIKNDSGVILTAETAVFGSIDLSGAQEDVETFF